MARVTMSKELYSVIYNTSVGQTYKLNTAALRAIYDNREKNFLFGSFIAAPVVDLLTSFIGNPKLVALDTERQAELDEALAANSHAVTEVQRMALRDGKAYLRVSWEDMGEKSKLYGTGEKGRIILTPLLADQVSVNKDPVTEDIVYAQIGTKITWTDSNGRTQSATIYTTITPDKEVVEQDESKSAGLAPGVDFNPKTNDSGVVPIIEFVNDPDPSTGEGMSEIARIAPYIAMYHDVLHHAVKGSKLHSVPKLHFGVEDVANFVKDNVGSNASTGVRNLELSGRDAVFTKPEEKAGYLEASNPIGASIDLLKKIFYCMIITAQTPEYALGVHMSSSYASTAEQSPVWQMKVERKQTLFAGYWQRAARMILAKQSYHLKAAYPSYAVRVLFESPDVRSAEQVANARKATVEAVMQAVREKLMSRDAGIEALEGIFPTMREFKSEKEAILEGTKELAALEQPANTAQTLDVDKALEGVGKMLKAGL